MNRMQRAKLHIVIRQLFSLLHRPRTLPHQHRHQHSRLNQHPLLPQSRQRKLVVHEVVAPTRLNRLPLQPPQQSQPLQPRVDPHPQRERS